MRKIVALLIPTAMIILFILILVSGSYLKQSFHENDNVPAIIKEITNHVKNEEWTAAKEGVGKLEVAWEIITDRVQFSAEREELKDGIKSIARMKGFIEANDKAGSLAELREVEALWSDIGQLL